ncbi:uncharacterized protein [Panulirus ornatus]|uniref:uncharacterized protein n=1 Tax=Panulirus ornatus TaxID=150431 RepID=UPI003A88690F
MDFKGAMMLAVAAVLVVLLQEVTADGVITTTEPITGQDPAIYGGSDTKLPLEGITIPENALSIGFESIGIFLLLAGVVGFIAYVVLGVDKTVDATATGAYPYPPHTTYSAPATNNYGASGSAYAQEESYNVHRNIDKAAAKYQ